jgi:hypothetical protein
MWKIFSVPCGSALYKFHCILLFKLYIFVSRVSSVGIVTAYGLDDGGVRVPVGVKNFFLTSPHHPDQLNGPSIHLPSGYKGHFYPGVKRQEREADHSPATSAEVKKTWINTSTPPYAVMARCLIS